jgi:hypothetical protein
VAYPAKNPGIMQDGHTVLHTQLKKIELKTTENHTVAKTTDLS